MNKLLNEFLSLSAAAHITSWIADRIKEQNIWRKKTNSYKVIIDKMLFSGGNFVFIPKKGDISVELLAKSGKRFKAQSKKIRASGSSNTKLEIFKYAQRDPKRYRVCIGYCLLIEHEISFWNKHYWIYDKKDKVILEATPMKPRYYFGVILSLEGTSALVTSAKAKVSP